MCDMVLKEMSYLSHNYYMRTASQIAQAYPVQNSNQYYKTQVSPERAGFRLFYKI